MADFSYLAIDPQGRRIKGQLSAHDLLQAEQQIIASGLVPIRLRTVWPSWQQLFASRVPSREVIAFTHQLGYLLKASVPLIDILADMQAQAHLDYPKLYPIICDVNRQLQSGQSLSSVLSSYPDVFDAVYLGAVLAGEHSGQLDLMFISLHERLQWLEKLDQRIGQMMVYPLLVLSVILGVTAILMTQLVPQLLTFLQDSGKPITAVTQSLIMTSDWLIDHGVSLVIFLVILVIAWRILLNYSFGVRRWQDRIVLQFGILGRIQHYLVVMRVTRVMALLYAAGLSFHQLLSISRQVTGNLYLAEHFEHIDQAVMSGQSLANAFDQAKIFPRMMIQLVHIGEQSGQLDQRLHDVSVHYQHEVDRLLAQIEPWIEPMMTLFLALLLGWVLIATIMPIYDTMG